MCFPKLLQQDSRTLTRLEVQAWERMAADALHDLLSVEVPDDVAKTARSHVGVLKSLILRLGQQNGALSIHAIKMIMHLSSPENCTCYHRLNT